MNVLDWPFWDPNLAPPQRFELTRQLSSENPSSVKGTGQLNEKTIRAAAWKDLLSMARSECSMVSERGKIASGTGLPPIVLAAADKAAWQLVDLIDITHSEAREQLLSKLADDTSAHKTVESSVRFLRNAPFDISDQREEERENQTSQTKEDAVKKTRKARRYARVAAEAAQSQHPEALYLAARAARAAKAAKAARGAVWKREDTV